jgi:hypothetical protein
MILVYCVKKYGRDFIAILKVMVCDYDAQTQEEFCGK